MHPYVQKLFILMTLLLVFSCSQKQTGVKLEVSNNFVFGGSNTSAIAAGGLMVWGRNSSGDAFGQALEDKDQINLQLNPGSWTFYAMSWDGSATYDGSPNTNIALGGKVRCARSPVTKLENSPVAVDLVLNNDTCQDVAFAGTVPTTGTAGNRSLPSTIFNFCSQMGPALNAVTQICADTKSEPNRVFGKGAVSSYRVVMRNYTGPSTSRKLLSGGVRGECVVFTGDAESGSEAPGLYGTSFTKMPNLPAGGTGYPFHMTLEMYPGSPFCEIPGAGQRGVMTKEFRNGISFADNSQNKYFPSGIYHRQYVEVSPAKVCEGRTGDFPAHPFAGGDGTIDRPYLICSVPQFHKINNSNTYLSKSFKLQANLDFNPYSVGLGNFAPVLFQCLGSGTNFIPIGYDAATCAGPGNPMVWGTLTPFTGDFFGGNFTLKNLRLREEGKDYLGIFANFRGGYLSELNIENAEISGQSYVGALAGFLQGSSAATDIHVWNITGSNMEIEARDPGAGSSKVGSIFGNINYATIKNVVVKNSKVRGEASEVGGLAGYSFVANLSEISIEADIDANSSAISKFNIGGLIGHAVDTSLQYVKHEGGIYTNAEQVGGILGAADSNTSLENFYTLSHIKTFDNGDKLGGVVGYWNSPPGMVFGPGYTFSRVRSFCTSSCTQGAVAGTITTQPSVVKTILTLPPADSGVLDTPASFTGESLTTFATSTQASSYGFLISAGPGNWSVVDGEYPRFDFENHPCHIAGVSGSGTGSLLNPFKICNANQYYAISANDNVTNAGKRYKLLSNLRLKYNSTLNFDINYFNAHLDGNNKFLLGGDANTGATDTSGHIHYLTGSISNLKIHGLGRQSTDTSPTSPHGVLVANNYGTLSDISAWTYPQWEDSGSGLVGTNETTGKIFNVSVDGVIRGSSQIASLALINNGVIQDSNVNGDFICNGTCHTFAGLVMDNSGSIERTKIQNRLKISGETLASFSMMVINNSGTIKDVLISEHSEMSIDSSTSGYYFYVTNTGSLNRIFNKGYLSLNDTTYSSTMTGFPVGNGTPGGGGTDTDVVRTGGKSGKFLLESAPFTCLSANTLNIPDWTSIVVSNDANWETAFGSGNYDAFPMADKKLIAHVKFPNGARFTQRVTTYNADTFGIATGDCNAASGTVDLYYSHDIPVDAAGVSIAGVMLPQYESVKGNYSPAWQNQIWDIDNNTSDKTAMLNYYAFILGVNPTPVTPKIWSIENGEGLRLFKND